jgi:hypothetical protein
MSNRDFSVAEVQSRMPESYKSLITQDWVDKVNTSSQDVIVKESIKDNIMNSTDVLGKGTKFSVDVYLNAVKFVTYTLMEQSKKEAYTNTFPKRVNAIRTKHAGKDPAYSERLINSYASSYAATEMVKLLILRVSASSFVLNYDNVQTAVGVVMDLMESAKSSDRTKLDAAKVILDNFKPPEKSQLDINVEIKEETMISSLQNLIDTISSKKKELILDGNKTHDVINNAKLIGTNKMIEQT